MGQVESEGVSWRVHAQADSALVICLHASLAVKDGGHSHPTTTLLKCNWSSMYSRKAKQNAMPVRSGSSLSSLAMSNRSAAAFEEQMESSTEHGEDNAD